MKLKFALFAIVAMFVFSGCSDDESPYTCKDCADQPEALAANDASGKGIYKGVIVGSTGSIKFNINNDGSGISADLVIDNHEIHLTTSATYSEANGFAGCFVNANEGVSICLTVALNGGSF